jgi:hypothetical protein
MSDKCKESLTERRTIRLTGKQSEIWDIYGAKGIRAFLDRKKPGRKPKRGRKNVRQT